jgi:Ca-activated chloride channel family protein
VNLQQTFKNTGGGLAEGRYIFPVPQGAAVSDFAITDGDRRLDAKILDKDEARRIYERIVAQQRDPGLLEYVGRNVLSARVFPLHPGQSRDIVLTYSQVAQNVGGMKKVVLPLATSKNVGAPIGTLIVDLAITSGKPISNIYSPTMAFSVKRGTERRARCVLEASNIVPMEDAIVYYSADDAKIALSLLTYKDGPEDGYFVLIADAKKQAGIAGKQPRKDVLFVFDRTGSMSGEKIEQAREALKFCVNSLNPQDRFALITFNESQEAPFGRLVPANTDNIRTAQDHIARMTASGGTNIHDALLKALDYFDKESELPIIIFVTDGLATVGITDAKQILTDTKNANVAKARIFCFGVGYDVNTHLLDTLAEETKGTSDYVRPGEKIEQPVSDFFSKIQTLALSDISLDFGGANVYDVYPLQNRLPDIFSGMQLVLYGRYRGDWSGSIQLKGRVMDKTERYDLRADMPSRDLSSPAIMQLWAARKIGYLLDEIRLHGASDELVKEVIRLSNRYGIITEYTSFLVDENEQRRMGVPVAEAPGGVFVMDATVAARNVREEAEKKSAEVSGAYAVGGSANAQSMKGGGGPAGPSGAADRAKFRNSVVAGKAIQYGQTFNVQLDNAGRLVDYNQKVQHRAGRTFFQRRGVWVDSLAKDKMSVIQIRAYSRAVSQLIERDTNLGKFVSLGEEVAFVQNGQLIRIGKEGKDELTAADLVKLFGK